VNTAGVLHPYIWTPVGHRKAVGALYLNARALYLNAQAILYSPSDTGKAPK